MAASDQQSYRSESDAEESIVFDLPPLPTAIYEEVMDIRELKDSSSFHGWVTEQMMQEDDDDDEDGGIVAEPPMANNYTDNMMRESLEEFTNIEKATSVA